MLNFCKEKEDEIIQRLPRVGAYDIKLLVDESCWSQPTGNVNVKFEGGEYAGKS